MCVWFPSRRRSLAGRFFCVSGRQKCLPPEGKGEGDTSAPAKTDMDKRNETPIVVCDIDGTISLVGPARAAMLQSENPDWDAFYEDPFDDEPVEKVCRLVGHLSRQHRIVFCTSRRDSVREKTAGWLSRHLGTDAFPNGFDLLMRRGKDPRPDTVVKPELLQERLREDGLGKDSVTCILEDSASMVRMWDNLGYNCLLVA